MKAVKATYEKGQLKFAEPVPDDGPVDVLVVFPELAEDLWEKILNDPTPRPALSALAEELLAEHARGETEPLDLGKL